MNMIRDHSQPFVEILTLALADEAFALDACMVSEIIDVVPVTEVPNAPNYAQGLINVRGKVVPLADLRVCLDLPRLPATIDTRLVVLELVIDDEPGWIGIYADKVYEVTKISASAIEAPPEVGLKWPSLFIRGIARRGADLLYILDLEAIFSSIRQETAGDFHDADRSRAMLATH